MNIDTTTFHAFSSVCELFAHRRWRCVFFYSSFFTLSPHLFSPLPFWLHLLCSLEPESWVLQAGCCEIQTDAAQLIIQAGCQQSEGWETGNQPNSPCAPWLNNLKHILTSATAAHAHLYRLCRWNTLITYTRISIMQSSCTKSTTCLQELQQQQSTWAAVQLFFYSSPDYVFEKKKMPARLLC